MDPNRMDPIVESSSPNDQVWTAIEHLRIKKLSARWHFDIARTKYSCSLPRKADKLTRCKPDGPTQRRIISELANQVQPPRVDRFLENSPPLLPHLEDRPSSTKTSKVSKEPQVAWQVLIRN